MLKVLSEPNVYDQLETRAAALAEGLQAATKRHGIDAWHSRVGSMLMFYFTDETVTDYEGVQTADTERYASYFWNLLENGVYVAPSQFETGFVSLAHSEADINQTIDAANEVLSRL